MGQTEGRDAKDEVIVVNGGGTASPPGSTATTCYKLVVVESVEAGGTASKAGVVAGDAIILGPGGASLGSVDDLFQLLKSPSHRWPSTLRFHRKQHTMGTTLFTPKHQQRLCEATAEMLYHVQCFPEWSLPLLFRQRIESTAALALLLPRIGGVTMNNPPRPSLPSPPGANGGKGRRGSRSSVRGGKGKEAGSDEEPGAYSTRIEWLRYVLSRLNALNRCYYVGFKPPGIHPYAYYQYELPVLHSLSSLCLSLSLSLCLSLSLFFFSSPSLLPLFSLAQVRQR